MKIETPHGWYVRQRERGWYRWFAWYPVTITGSSEKYIWLEWVERRITGMNHSEMKSTATYEYRELESLTNQ